MKRVPSQRGVTLVELLITIVIAGIFFAGLVPLFVQASQTSSADNARTVALGLAQDKMERVRSLPYSDIETDLLYADTARGLGHYASATIGSGGKQYLVDYSVERVWDPDSVYHEDGLELYKRVTVDVYWEGNPRPVKHVILRTAIYRQHTGPSVLSLQVSPRSAEGATAGMIVPGVDGIITVSAYVSTAAGVQEVRFKAESASGSYSKDFTQTTGAGGVYTWQWVATDAPDGFYAITATALSTGGELGNTWRVVEQLENADPPSPANLTASLGDQSVTLDWEKPAAGDIDYYEIWRSETSDALSAAALLETGLKAVHYADESVVNGTHYYYWVYAVDLVGNVSDPAAADGTPSLAAGEDLTPPSVPVLTASVQSTTVTLSWAVSLDPPPPDPSSGVAYYEVYRSSDGINFTDPKKVVAQDGVDSMSYVDPVGSDSPQYWYQIRAVDRSVNVNRSAFSAPLGPLQTPATRATLTVTNDRTAANRPCSVTVQDVVSRLYYAQNGVASPSPQAVTIASKGGSAQWLNLPIDRQYTVTATYTQGSPLTASRSAPPWTVSFR